MEGRRREEGGKCEKMFGRKKKTYGDDKDDDDYDASEEVYETPLPPSMPVVKATIDTIVELAVSQRLFLSQHADKLKLELVKEREGRTLADGSWYLNGFSLTDEDALDLVRASPDTLSNLTYTNYTDTTSIWAKLTSWLRFGSKEASRSGINVADDLAFGLAVCEVVEVAGHVLAGVSYAMSSQAPRLGKPLTRKLAFEMTSSLHRGRSHSMYLVADISNSAQRTASSRTSNILKANLSLYIYTPMLLNGLKGVAVNVSGRRVDDLPESGIDEAELMRVLSKKGVFVANAASNFLLDSNLEVSSQRAATVTLVATERLVDSANSALTAFFADEYAKQESIRASERREKLKRELEAARERERAELQREAAERAERDGSERAETRYRVDPNADPQNMVQTFRARIN